jgi:methyl-accepting chemotaxis protein
VEAARAGEAGAGFAVVADEVRNLAMRAAEAARNTSNLVEDIVKKIRGGVTVVTETNRSFSEVMLNSNKVRELVGEIAAASKEQAQGIEQVNQAVAEMNHVTQQNAAGAEELASIMATFKTGTNGHGMGVIDFNGKDGEMKLSLGNRTVPRLALSQERMTPQQVIPLGENDF